jgi:hypothetical protein
MSAPLFSTVTFTHEALPNSNPLTWSGSPSARAVIKSPSIPCGISGSPAVFDDGWWHRPTSPHEFVHGALEARAKNLYPAEAVSDC